MTLTNTGLVAFAKKMLSLGDDTVYVYGTFGQQLTQSLINSKCNQYSYNVARKKLYESIMASTGTEYAFDCVGLIKAYMWGWNNGKYTYVSSQDKSANGMYSAAKVKGSISTMPEVPGVLVQMDGHIGVYIGNGYVIESTPSTTHAKQNHKGGGVCKTKLSARKWEHWLECPYITYIKEESKPVQKPNVETYFLVTSVKIYQNAANAKKGQSSVGTYAKGTYYVFKKYNGMINITKTKGKAGAWINPADNVEDKVQYYPKYTGTSGSIAAALKSIGVDSSYSFREKIAKVNSISNYRGTADQNTKMLNLLKQGKLKKV